MRQAIDSFKDGVVTLVDESRLPISAVKEAINLIQKQDGRWTKRPGTGYYGPDLGDTCDGAFQFVKTDGSTELMALAGGTLKRVGTSSTTNITGASFTDNVFTFAKQIAGRGYLSNGTDNLSYYNGSTISIYSNLTQPTNVAVAKTTLTTGNVTPYYQIVALNEVGHSLPSTATTITNGINKTRSNWSGTEKLTVTWDAVTNATRYEIYYNESNGELYYLDSVATGVLTYDDFGTAPLNTLSTAPVDNTSTGPKFSHMEISGNRIWATGNSADPYAVYFGGLGAYQGAFSPFYGGGWVRLEAGGADRPTTVVHFKDGRGSTQITVFCSNPEGTGSIHQVELIDTTIGDTSFVIPTPEKIVGSVGTNAPRGVVKVGDSVLFINKTGVFSLGSRPNVLNYLSTREISNSIRPFIRSLNGAAFTGICGYYRDGKVYWSVPSGGSTTNNVTMVLDLERNNFNPRAFTIGFKHFFEYTGSDGVTHFLGVSYTATKLVEISETYLGDLDEPFETSLQSGLIPVSTDRLEWARVKDVVFELGQPQGAVSLQILGTEKRKGFSSIGSVTITDTVSNAGLGVWQLGTTQLGDSPEAPVVFAQSSVKKVVRTKRKLLNNWQWRITTQNINDNYALLSVQPRGQIVMTRDPSSWRNTT